MSTKNDIIAMIRERIGVQHAHALPDVKGEHVDYTQAKFYELNPSWIGKPEKSLAYYDWMMATSLARMQFLESQAKAEIDDMDLPF